MQLNVKKPPTIKLRLICGVLKKTEKLRKNSMGILPLARIYHIFFPSSSKQSPYFWISCGINNL